MKPPNSQEDVWRHRDGTEHSASGPLGCMPCANLRRGPKPPSLHEIRIKKLEAALREIALYKCASGTGQHCDCPTCIARAALGEEP